MRFLADEHIPRALLEQLELHLPGVDIVHASDVGLAHTPDPDILQWAADNRRVVISRDKKTMRNFAYARITAGLPMPGLIILHRRISIGPAIRGIIEFATECRGELDGQVAFVHAPRRTLI